MGNWWLGIFSGSVVVSISKSFFCRFVEYLQTTIITFPHPQEPRQADCKSLDRNLSSHRPPWQHHHHYQSSVCSDIYFLPTVFSSQGSFFYFLSNVLPVIVRPAGGALLPLNNPGHLEKNAVNLFLLKLVHLLQHLLLLWSPLWACSSRCRRWTAATSPLLLLLLLLLTSWNLKRRDAASEKLSDHILDHRRPPPRLSSLLLRSLPPLLLSQLLSLFLIHPNCGNSNTFKPWAQDQLLIHWTQLCLALQLVNCRRTL